MSNGRSDFDRTSYLRGIAIISVVINHYLNAFVSTDYGGYANGLIAIFFVLSGYGLYKSLEKSNFAFDSKSIYNFVIKRALRIYPLYWAFYILYLKNHPFRFVDFFAVDFIDPDTKWFIPAIVQCYILSPFIYAAIKRLRMRHYILLSLLVVVVMNVVLHWMGMPTERVFYYRNLYLSHLLLFAFGMALPILFSRVQFHSTAFTGVVGCLLACLPLVLTRSRYESFPINVSVGLFFVVAFIVFVAIVLRGDFSLPVMRAFKVAGVYSYSIYLFHRHFLWLVHDRLA